MIESHARDLGRRIDRFERGALAKPLLQQEGCGSTVETTARVSTELRHHTSLPQSGRLSVRAF